METLREFSNPVLAGIVQSFLKDNKIKAILLDQGASAWTAGRTLDQTLELTALRSKALTEQESHL